MSERHIVNPVGSSDTLPDRETLGISPYAAVNRAEYLPEAILEPYRNSSDYWDTWGKKLSEAGYSMEQAESFISYAELEQLTDSQIERILKPSTEEDN